MATHFRRLALADTPFWPVLGASPGRDHRAEKLDIGADSQLYPELQIVFKYSDSKFICPTTSKLTAQNNRIAANTQKSPLNCCHPNPFAPAAGRKGRVVKAQLGPFE